MQESLTDLRGQVLNVVSSQAEPLPHCSVTIKRLSSGQTSWEVSYSGSDPHQVLEVAMKMHERLVAAYVGSGAEGDQGIKLAGGGGDA